MTNKEAILVLKSTLVNLGRRSGKTAYAEALEMAIAALQELDINPTKPNNSNDEVNNSTATQSNGIESKVKGLTACRVPEDDCISRQAAIDIFDDYNVSVENGELEAYSRDRKRLCDLPSVQTTQPNTPNTLETLDCIDRQETIDKAKELFDMGDCYCDKYSIVGMINSLPSVQPETCDTCKHGYFGDEQCNDCRVRFTSHYERRTDEQTKD